jgi:hypothetical protein
VISWLRDLRDFRLNARLVYNHSAQAAQNDKQYLELVERYNRVSADYHRLAEDVACLAHTHRTARLGDRREIDKVHGK